MAVLSVTECTLLKASNKFESESPTAQRQFFVRFDAAPADLDAVCVATDGTTAIPAINSAYKTGDNRLLKTITPSSIGTTLDYLVVCDFAIPSTGSFNPNPLLRPDDIKGGGTSRDKPYFVDFSDDPQQVVTSAYEPFDTLPQNTCGEWSFSITGNRATLPLATWMTYLDPKGVAINDAAVTIRGITFPAGTLKIRNIRFARKTEGSYSFWEVEWELAAAESWDQDIDDRGYFQLTDAGDGVVPIYGADGITPVSKPAALDGTGYAAAVATDAAYLTFTPQPKKDFSVFTWTSAE